MLRLLMGRLRSSVCPLSLRRRTGVSSSPRLWAKPTLRVTSSTTCGNATSGLCCWYFCLSLLGMRVSVEHGVEGLSFVLFWLLQYLLRNRRYMTHVQQHKKYTIHMNKRALSTTYSTIVTASCPEGHSQFAVSYSNSRTYSPFPTGNNRSAGDDILLSFQASAARLSIAVYVRLSLTRFMLELVPAVSIPLRCCRYSFDKSLYYSDSSTLYKYNSSIYI